MLETYVNHLDRSGWGGVIGPVVTGRDIRTEPTGADLYRYAMRDVVWTGAR